MPLHPTAIVLIHDYLDAAAGRGLEDTGAVFRSTSNNRDKQLQKQLRQTEYTSWYRNTQKSWGSTSVLPHPSASYSGDYRVHRDLL